MAELTQEPKVVAEAEAKAATTQGEKDVTPGCPACSGGTGADADGVAYKHTPRSEELQRDVTRRLNRAIGQLNGVKAMIDDNRYCGDVLVQLSAASSAIQSIERIVLENHLKTCVAEEIRNGNDDVIDEAMGLIKRITR